MACWRPQRAVGLGLVACTLCGLTAAANQRYIEDEGRFPGWKGVLPSQYQQQQPTVQEPAPETTGYGELGQVTFLLDLKDGLATEAMHSSTGCSSQHHAVLFDKDPLLRCLGHTSCSQTLRCGHYQ